MNNTVATPQISDHDRLGMTLFLAIMLHGIVILGITFSISPNAKSNTMPTLDIILVQSHNPSENDKAEFLAQITQQGGGESKTKARPSDLFTAPSLSQNPGMALQESQQQKASMKQTEKLALINQENSDFNVDTNTEHQSDNDITLVNQNNTQQSQNLARLAEELDKKIEYEADASKTKYLNSSTKEFIPAQYMHNWINRVERIGNLNYPDKARREKLNGTLILDVVINANGKLVKTDLRRSSGHQLLDDAAMRIVQLAAPYSPFPKELKEVADVIHITRSWEFLNSNQIRTN